MHNPEALQALGNKLNIAVFILSMMNAHSAANGRQFVARRHALARLMVIDKADPEHFVVGFAYALERLLPGVLIDHNRLYLRREKRAI